MSSLLGLKLLEIEAGDLGALAGARLEPDLGALAGALAGARLNFQPDRYDHKAERGTFE